MRVGSLDRDGEQRGIEPCEVKRIAGNDGGLCLLRANDHVRVRNIPGAGLGQQDPDGLGMGSVQGDHLGPVKLDHPPQPGLPGRIPNHLGESRGRDDEPSAVPEDRVEQHVERAVIPFERDQPARVENDALHATFRGLAVLGLRLRGDIIFLAHSRSFGVTGPPVSANT